MSHLDTAVRTVVRDCLAVSSGERVLVVSDSFAANLANLFREAAEAMGAEARAMEIDATERDGQEPPAEVAEAMASVDVVIAQRSDRSRTPALAAGRPRLACASRPCPA